MLLRISLALVALSALIAGCGAFNSSRPYEVTASFLSAEGVTERNDVVISGVPVGQVTAVALADESSPTGAGAKITMQIQPRFAPLRKGTRAEIRPKGLLGNMFIELTPGSQGNERIPSGGSIPVQDTASPVDLDQINDIFDKATREKVKTATLEGGKTFKDRGQDINKILSRLPTITGDAADVTAKIAEQDRALDRLQVEFDNVAYQMASEDQSFRNDIVNGASLLDTFAAHSTQLQDEITYANRSLGKLNGALRGHEQDLNALLKAMPGLETDVQQFSNSSSTSLQIIDPCMADIIRAIQYQREAMVYSDANGNMLRVRTISPPLGNAPEKTQRVTGAQACGMPPP
jgi:virulence factor Mce-like protein